MRDFCQDQKYLYLELAKKKKKNDFLNKFFQFDSFMVAMIQLGLGSVIKRTICRTLTEERNQRGH